MSELTIFQKIWDVDVTSYPLYRNESVHIGLMAILDIYAATRGHTLIVPIEAADTWDDLPPHREQQAAILGRYIRRHLAVVLDPKPIRVTKLNIGSGVHHVHDQLIPMYERGDTQKLWLPERLDSPRPTKELDAVFEQVMLPEAISYEVDKALAELSMSN
jgi:diadenosine tetraphosphate (Ap4A) HIT family hydrolase